MISYEVEFPTKKSFSLKINGYSSAEGLDCITIDAIGGDVKVQIDKKTMLTLTYREDITADFTFEGYKKRAEKHALEVVEKVVRHSGLALMNGHNEGNEINFEGEINVCTK
ncbi:hypothetical protein [Citrobacter freundii]|uniref:hypothetical protein n=1 Tax=Citrobacter freundii TaxID=546 RepID=UPI003D6F1C59